MRDEEFVREYFVTERDQKSQTDQKTKKQNLMISVEKNFFVESSLAHEKELLLATEKLPPYCSVMEISFNPQDKLFPYTHIYYFYLFIFRFFGNVCSFSTPVTQRAR